MELYAALCAQAAANPQESVRRKALLRWISSQPSARNISDEDRRLIVSTLRLCHVGLPDFSGYNEEEAYELLSRDSGDGRPITPGAVRRVAIDSFTSARQFAEEAVSPTRKREHSRRSRTPPPPQRPENDPLTRAMVNLLRVNRGSANNNDLDADHFLRELDDADKFDLAAFRSKQFTTDHSRLDVNSFGDLVRISRIARERDRLKHNGTPYLSSSSIEEWQPRWLGSLLPPADRTLMRRQRMKHNPHSAAALCNSVGAFYLSHAAIGAVEILSVLAHLLILLRLADERTLATATTYSAMLQTSLHTRIAEGEKFSIDDAISRIDHNILRQAEAQARQELRFVPRPPDPATPRSPPRRPPRKVPRPDLRPPRRPPVCFDNDPASGRKCSIKNCPKTHLDTTKPEELARYSKAHESFQLRKKAASAAGTRS